MGQHHASTSAQEEACTQAPAEPQGEAQPDLLSALEQVGPDVLQSSLWHVLSPSSRLALRVTCKRMLVLADKLCTTGLMVPEHESLTMVGLVD